MALGKLSRVGGRKSSDYCSTITVVMFVSFSLVGVWMLMSSSVVPMQNSDSSSQAIIDEVKQELTGSENFEETSSELPKNEIQRDDNGIPVKESIVVDTQEEKSVTESNDEATVSNHIVKEEQESSDKKTKSEEKSKTQVENDEGEGSAESESKSGFGDSKSEAEGGISNKISPNESEGSLGENKTESVEVSQTDKVVSQNQDKNLDQNIGDDIKNAEQNIGDNNKSSEQNIGDKKKNSEQKIEDNNMESHEKVKESIENFPAADQSEILNETNTQNGAWSTQTVESQKEKESQQSSILKDQNQYSWKLCNTAAGPDYIPCLDNWQTIRRLPSTKHYEHRERHCPEEAPTCVVPMPEGYRRLIKWPKSRTKV